MTVKIGNENHWSWRLMNKIFMIYIPSRVPPTVFPPCQPFYTETASPIVLMVQLETENKLNRFVAPVSCTLYVHILQLKHPACCPPQEHTQIPQMDRPGTKHSVHLRGYTLACTLLDSKQTRTGSPSMVQPKPFGLSFYSRHLAAYNLTFTETSGLHGGAKSHTG